MGAGNDRECSARLKTALFDIMSRSASAPPVLTQKQESEKPCCAGVSLRLKTLPSNIMERQRRGWVYRPLSSFLHIMQVSLVLTKPAFAAKMSCARWPSLLFTKMKRSFYPCLVDRVSCLLPSKKDYANK
jgi:hypothetical protein